jgi:hypothetical protein
MLRTKAPKLVLPEWTRRLCNRLEVIGPPRLSACSLSFHGLNDFLPTHLVRLGPREVHDQVKFVDRTGYDVTRHGPLKVIALTSHFVALQPELDRRRPGFEDRTRAGLANTNPASR